MPITYELKEDAPHKGFQPPSDSAHERRPYPQKVEEDLRVEVLSEDRDTLVLDMVGTDVSTANALRRIMLAEVPTVAIEQVYVNMNTSILHDEMLAHRLGLVPIDADPRDFHDFSAQDDEANEYNTVVFKLHVVCGSAPPGEEVSDDGRPYTRNVVSGDLEWIPQGSQLERFPDGIHPVHSDILLAKLRPGQALQMELHCRKGRGKDHAKFSPVATASYRMLPSVKITQDITGKKAEQLVRRCPLGVFDIEEVQGGQRAVVAHPKKCTMCRECIRDSDANKDSIKLERVDRHLTFCIEAVGMLLPRDVLHEAVSVLKIKCQTFLDRIEQYELDAGLQNGF
jgi:DNA-directed RNA polymerase I and III subunit RPAC1